MQIKPACRVGITREVVKEMKRSTLVQNRFVSLLLAVVMLFGLLPGFGMQAGAANEPFRDVSDSDWYAEAVSEVYQDGYMDGTGGGLFSPDDTLTRAMFVTVLGRIHGVTPDQYDYTVFADAPRDSWFGPYVSWAYSIRIVDGYGDGGYGFGSEDPITREQMAAIIARYVDFLDTELPDGDNTVSSFRDAAQVSPYAREGLELMRRTGIIVGDQRGYFNPLDNATRAEAATIFVRLSDALDAEEEPANTYEEIQDITSDFRELDSEYAGSDGIIDTENTEEAIDAFKALASDLKSRGKLTDWEECEGNFAYKTEGGVGGVYMPAYEWAQDLAGLGGQVLVYQPTLQEKAFAKEDKNAPLADAAKKIVTASAGGFVSGYNRSDSGVTVDSVKDWRSGSLIIWNGHGNYTDTFKESFMTGEAYTQSADQKYRSDLDQDRLIVCSSMETSDRLSVTTKFFDYYYDDGDLDGSLVFMGACQSFYDDSLADIITEKLGATYIGSTKKIQIPYLHDMLISFLDRLDDKDENGKFYTAQNALDYAKSQHLPIDVIGAIGLQGAELKLVGDGSFALDAGIQSRTLRVLDPTGTTGVAGATVKLFADGVGGEALQTVTTDAQGYCTLKDLSDSISYRVQIRADGYMPSEYDLPDGASPTIRLTGMGAMQITIKSADERPLTMYAVTVKNSNGTTVWEDDRGLGSATNESSITLTTNELPTNADYTITASASNYTAVTQTVRLTDEQPFTVEIELYRGAYGCEGTVVDDATGQPLPGMTVELVTNSGTVGGTTTTDQNGQFEVMGSAGLSKYSLRVSGSGYETYLNGDFLFALNEPSNVGTIRMKSLNTEQPEQPETPPETDGDYILLYTADDLASISDQPGNFKLANDIDATDYSMHVISQLHEDAVLDGDGHTIRVDQRNQYFGGLIECNYGTIRNLHVTGTATFEDESTLYFGGIVGYNAGLIEDCSFNGTIRTSGGLDYNDSGSDVGAIGGICGINEQGTVRGCTVDGNITLALDDAGWKVGGICGYARGNTLLEDCINNTAVSVDITGSAGDYDSAYVGGICGYCSGWETDEITHCLNTASIMASTTNGVTYAAGVCAWSGISYDCGNTGSSISAGYGGQLPSHAKSQANAVSSSMGNEGYTSNTILYDSEHGTRSASESNALKIRSASEILAMWS